MIYKSAHRGLTPTAKRCRRCAAEANLTGFLRLTASSSASFSALLFRRDGFARKVGPACRAGPSQFVKVENYQGPFRQKGPTTDCLRKAPAGRYFCLRLSVRPRCFVWPTIPLVRPPWRGCSPAPEKFPSRRFGSCSLNDAPFSAAAFVMRFVVFALAGLLLFFAVFLAMSCVPVRRENSNAQQTASLMPVARTQAGGERDDLSPMTGAALL
jgi:hypothetical protein